MKDFLTLTNFGRAPLGMLPILPPPEFRREVLTCLDSGCRVLAFFAIPERESASRLIAVLGDPAEHRLLVSSTLAERQYSSFTTEAPAFHLFERELFEDSGIVPVGHPALHPVRRYSDADLVAVRRFRRMSGGAAHEVAVGPIHAGVIEPGHFRFQCMGEDVYLLEIALGYQHRGVEKLLAGGPDGLTLHRIETVAGDASVASAMAYCGILESLSDVAVPEVVRLLRGLALELERIANHVGDLGALSGDVAFLPAASFCGRIRGEYLNMTAELCGNRFGRGLVRPGTCGWGMEKARAEKLSAWIGRVRPELDQALGVMFATPSVIDRFENTGTVPPDTARKLGMVGPAARASGLNVDARADFPLPGYRLPSPVRSCRQGDVNARARIRRDEIAESHRLIAETLENWPEKAEFPPESEATLAPDSIAVAVVEAWRGELCHVALTDSDGRLRRYKIVDPSFHNWSGLAMAMRGEQISNFPICNKSFNLSYCGHDL